MTTWHIVRGCYGAAVLLIGSAFVVGLAAIWTQSERVGQTAMLAATTGLFLAFGTFMFCIDGSPSRPMPGGERKRLEAEKARIETDRLIRRMEREAGL